ncbi:MAG: hypothetical protein NC084_07060 [Bacteroides sp.]|nr:hypothetical protein [Roseburia sp.]MCM1462460.1 hypothetical protein [Bacteroides sp.]
MRPLKIIAILMTALFMSGCGTGAVSETEISSETTISSAITTVSETAAETAPEADGEALLAAHFQNAPRNFRAENRPPETGAATLAEELYRLLYDFAELNDYLYHYVPESFYGFIRDPETGGQRSLLPENDDFITADVMWIDPAADPEDEAFAVVTAERFSRVRYGEIKTVGEYTRRISRVATWEYTALDCPWLGGRLRSSGGDLYISDFEQRMGGVDSESTLNEIVRIDDDTLLLRFTATRYYAETRVEREDYTVTLSRGKSHTRDREPDGKWRVDRCRAENADDLSCEIVRGGINGRSPKTDLPEEIERCLREIGEM